MTQSRLILAAAAGFVLVAGGVALWMKGALSERAVTAAPAVPAAVEQVRRADASAPDAQVTAQSSLRESVPSPVSSQELSPEQSRMPSVSATQLQGGSDERLQDGTFDTAALTESQGRAGELISALRASGEATTTDELDRATTLQQELLDLTRADDAALAAAVDAFVQNPGNVGVDMLGDVLGQLRDPRVEAAAVELVQSAERGHVLSGLKLLGDLKLPNRQTLGVVLNTIHANTHDPEVLANALYALPKVPMSSEDTGALIRTFQSLTNHADSGIRSESMFKIAQFAKTPAELQPVVNGLNSTADDDRISAAMAIQSSPVVSQELREQLLARLSDEAELWEVRAMAADALERFSLSGEDFAQYEESRRHQDTVATQAPQTN